MTGFTLQRIEAPTPEDRQRILDRLGAFNRDTAGPTGFGAVCIGIYDAEGALQGGLWGATLFAWLTIDLLFVPEEMRGRGAGARLHRRLAQHLQLPGPRLLREAGLPRVRRDRRPPARRRPLLPPEALGRCLKIWG